MIKILNAKIPMLLVSINKLKTDSLDSKEIMNIISVKKELEKISEIVSETQEKILSSYGLKSLNGSYTWIGHDKSDEITEKIKSLLEDNMELSTQPFMDEENFYSSVKGMSVNEIAELSNILLKS